MRKLTLIISLVTAFYSSFVAAELMEVKMVEAPFEGSTLFVPNDGNDKHPAIILYHGSEGGLNGYVRNQARYLARRGFVTLFYCYFDCIRTASQNKAELHNIELSKSLDAFNWLKNLEITTDKIGLYGVSRGAEKTLLLTALMQREGLNLPDLVAVHAPSNTIVEGYNPNWSNWMCWPYNSSGSKEWDSNCGSNYPRNNPELYPAWLYNNSTDNISPKKRIEIEKYLGPIFITHGAEDTLWSADRTRAIQDSILTARQAQKDAIMPEIHIFEGEGHSFSSKAEIKRWRYLLAFFHKYLD